MAIAWSPEQLRRGNDTDLQIMLLSLQTQISEKNILEISYYL